MTLAIEYDEDDLPAAPPNQWEIFVSRLPGRMPDPEAAALRKKAHEKTERWKEQHRIAARESARRRAVKVNAARRAAYAKRKAAK